MVCEMRVNWAYRCFFFVGCCFQDLFKIIRIILLYFPSSFFSKHSVKVQVVQPYYNTDTATVNKNYLFILSERLGFLVYILYIQFKCFFQSGYEKKLLKKPFFKKESIYIYIYIYSSEHKDQNDVKKKFECEITFYFKTSVNILSRKNKDIKVNYIIPKYKTQ